MHLIYRMLHSLIFDRQLAHFDHCYYYFNETQLFFDVLTWNASKNVFSNFYCLESYQTTLVGQPDLGLTPAMMAQWFYDLIETRWRTINMISKQEGGAFIVAFHSFLKEKVWTRPITEGFSNGFNDQIKSNLRRLQFYGIIWLNWCQLPLIENPFLKLINFKLTKIKEN